MDSGPSKSVYNILVCVLIFVRFVRPHNHQRQLLSWPSLEENDTVQAMDWINPCGVTHLNYEQGARPRDPKLLNILRASMKNFVDRLKREDTNAIDISDINDWSTFNPMYTFLHQINPITDKVSLQHRHQDVQIYVGALQNLAHNQRKYDLLHNEDNAVTIEIERLLVLAKNILCEIETVIERTRQPLRIVFTREEMDRLLTFRNNNSIGKFNGEVDELDNKFTKARFHEYVENLQRLLDRPGKVRT